MAPSGRFFGPLSILRGAALAFAVAGAACATGDRLFGEAGSSGAGGSEPSGSGAGASTDDTSATSASTATAGGAAGTGGSGGASGGGGLGAGGLGSGGLGSASSTATTGSGGAHGDACTVFETSVMCMPDWIVVYVDTTNSQGGHFTYATPDPCLPSITDVNCNTSSSVGTSCPGVVGQMMTVTHDPCDNSPSCSTSFVVVCP